VKDVWPAHLVSSPEEYPAPEAGPVVRWALRTPAGEPVGTLPWNDGGLSWTFASGVSVDAQEHGAEVQEFLRGCHAEGVALADCLESIEHAYAGDLTVE
jgi:hypothetical protein